MVFHWNFITKKNVDTLKLKSEILELFKNKKAKFPAEHNVGHLYESDENLKNFYRELDPTNSFNSGIGMDSKKKDYG